jgi:hypothetical protein
LAELRGIGRAIERLGREPGPAKRVTPDECLGKLGERCELIVGPAGPARSQTCAAVSVARYGTTAVASISMSSPSPSRPPTRTQVAAGPSRAGKDARNASLTPDVSGGSPTM